MRQIFRNSFLLISAVICSGWLNPLCADVDDFVLDQQEPADTNEPDSLAYPFYPDESGGVFGDNPSNFKDDVVYDPQTGNYIVTEKIGGLIAKPPMMMTPEEYRAYVARKQAQDYWQSKTQSAEAAKAEGRDPESSLIPQIQVEGQLFRTLFGSNTIDIRPQGFAQLSFGGRIQKLDNPIIPERNRSTFTFDFDQQIQMNVTGKIGEKLEVKTNYDTEATFNFENQVKLEYTGDEDDIIKKIEMGNVSLPLNSTLISGAQSLFGVKGQFQFGKLMITSVFSEQRSQTSSINVQGGATTTEFEIWGDEYEANRHFFLAHYFRDNYERFLRNSPLVTSPVQITKVEVWVTNTRQSTQNNRNIVAFQDLGETENTAFRSPDTNLPGPNIFPVPSESQFPDNDNNDLDPDALEATYPGVRDIGQVNQDLNAAGFIETSDYTELANARRLRESEYDVNRQLGYISLNTSLNQDEVLAVAFQYVVGGQTYQVGEFSTDGVTPPKNLVTKMLKSTILNVNLPMWDLMMKNVYSLDAFQVNRDDFQIQVLYQNDETGTPVPFLPGTSIEDDLLLRVMNLDKVNANNDPSPDGFFDYIPNVTIRPQNGKIIFPVLEPFGSHLSGELANEEEREEYVFQELYDSTRFVAQNETQLNKFLMKGQFSSASGSEIKLDAFNIPQGSVTVTAGGTKLVEGQDYTVDYNLGRVKILNEGILNSGVPIRVDFENNALFNFQTKTFAGLDAQYKVNDNLSFGATMAHLSERPLTQKVNIGDEPIANTIIGANASYSKEAPYLTRLVDNIPFIDTKEKSNLSVQGEVAQMIPGSPRGIKINGEETTYLDDFESSQTFIDIKNSAAWRLASTPSNQPDLFPEADRRGLVYNFNRARMAWYTIDPLFFRDEARTPDNISDNKDLQSQQWAREVLVNEVFPNIQLQPSQPRNINMLDLAFYPNERGPYNFDVEPTGVSAGIKGNGELRDPESRWGGIMRAINSTNFEQQNIEFIQFWMMNPYVGLDDEDPKPDPDGGYLYFNLGSVSEDILKDGKQAVENGIPIGNSAAQLDSTPWGFVPSVRPPVVAFNNDEGARDAQDVGYDLLTDQQEATWAYDSTRADYLTRLSNAYGTDSTAYTQAVGDPAGDNFQYYRGDNLDAANANILERYKLWNNPQGNSDPTPVQGVSAFATNVPDIEDLNRDQTLSKSETYYQYRVSLRPEDLQEVGQNFITDTLRTLSSELPNGERKETTWIQFKIPIFNPDKKVGPISDFRSIRFIRMFMRGFDRPMVLRFARLEFVRGEWRRFQFDLGERRDQLSEDEDDNTIFEVTAVNIEQNAERQPVNYVLPPGIDRQVLFGTTAATQQNEQSLSLRIIDLEDGDARAVFRNLDFDMRLYKKLKMFTHAEAANDPNGLNDDDLNVFIRMGSDYNQNYYEYELPLKVTPWGTTDASPGLIWPQDNEMNFNLDLLKEVKLERDRVLRDEPQRTLADPYTVQRGKGEVTVVGAPNLGNVRTIMIGVRNPQKRFDGDGDDGLTKSAEIWVNELRLTEFDQRGGWAANARVAAKLADFADVSVSGRTSSVGWGSLDQSVSERRRESEVAYNLQSSVQLGKFFPKDAGLRIPMFFNRGETWITPQFNPLDPDIEFERSLENFEDPSRRDSIRKLSQDYTRRRSINFTNVRKDRTGGNRNDANIYDIENFSASYSFNEVFRRNINIEYDRQRTYRGSLNYSFRTNPKPVEPFKNVKFLQNDIFKIIRDFNFFYYPKNITAIATVNRNITEMKMRNTNDIVTGLDQFPLPETVNKNLTFDRQYSFLFDITKNLRLDYNARMNTRIDELIDTNAVGEPDTYTQEQKDSAIWAGLKEFGRPTNYHQTVSLNWQVPINQFPLLDFANVQARYSGDYDWRANSLAAQRANNSSLNFGNTIQNNRQIQLQNSFSMTTLYNKIDYLKKVNQGGGKQRNRRRPRLRRPGAGGERQEQQEQEEEEDEEQTIFDKILARTARTVMMVRNVSVNYTRNKGTIVPGFLPQPNLFGMSGPTNNYAPGLDFTLGLPTDIKDLAAQNDWLTKSPNQPNQFTSTESQNINLRATLEPFEDFRIVLTGSQNESSNLSEFFRWDTVDQKYDAQNTFITKNYSVSFFSLSSAFESLEAPDFDSEVYEQFLRNREFAAAQLARENADEIREFDPDYDPTEFGSNDPDSSNFGNRYFSYASQNVLIPAFLAAYSGNDIRETDLNEYKRSFPMPNWNVTYDGLSKLDFIKEFFNSFSLNHAYRSTYTVNNISTNLLRRQKLQDDEDPVNNNGDLLPELQISSLSVTEQFSPLIGVNAKMANNITIRLQYKTNRNITLGLTNNQITETRGKEWVIGAGYIIQDVKLKFLKLGQRKTSPVSNLELKADVGIRDNVTIIRQIVQGVDQPTAGQTNVTVKLSGDYQISSRVQAKAFYDLNLSRFKTSNAFPLTTNQFGIQVRLNLGQ